MLKKDGLVYFPVTHVSILISSFFQIMTVCVTHGQIEQKYPLDIDDIGRGKKRKKSSLSEEMTTVKLGKML